jgi:ATP-dependent Clp protease protease subunit
MIHQPLGGGQGQETDISIVANRLIKVKKRLNTILSNNTGKPLSQIEIDTERDYFLDANEALKYGLIDKIIDQ